MVKLPILTGLGKSLWFLVAVTVAAMGGNCQAYIVESSYFDDYVNQVSEHYNIPIENIFPVAKVDNSRFYSLVKTDNQYKVIEYMISNTGVFSYSTNIALALYYTGNDNDDNSIHKISHQAMYDYLITEPQIITSRINTTNLSNRNIVNGENVYQDCFIRFLTGGNFCYYVKDINDTSKYDVYINQDNEFVVNNFDGNVVYYDSNLQQISTPLPINNSYSINMNILNRYKKTLIQIVSSGIFITTVSLCIGGAIVWWLIEKAVDLLKAILQVRINASTSPIDIGGGSK